MIVGTAYSRFAFHGQNSSEAVFGGRDASDSHVAGKEVDAGAGKNVFTSCQLDDASAFFR